MTTKQHQRVWYIGALLLGSIGLGIIIASAFQENMMFFMTPTELLDAPQVTKKIRLGGLVEKRSVQKDSSNLTLQFKITDNKSSIPVVYRGIVPDLFRESQGVIAEGKLNEKGVFQAVQLLAKHDENYMPPEIAKKIK